MATEVKTDVAKRKKRTVSEREKKKSAAKAETKEEEGTTRDIKTVQKKKPDEYDYDSSDEEVSSLNFNSFLINGLSS
ncbi:unnamed protein product [Cylicostephanus goldi]|uniref:Uncharacterized protein n=1 Tax=Cylicostephanus goldi TaxID=71465 RepID=A0A3P6V150_CYLGO|nr:unnamed protein product [Cylicostephanus goldi]